MPRGVRSARSPSRARPVRRGGKVHWAGRVPRGGAGVGAACARGLRRRLVRAVPPHRARRRLGLGGIRLLCCLLEDAYPCVLFVCAGVMSYSDNDGLRLFGNIDDANRSQSICISSVLALFPVLF
jgi:hypothetical protein